MNVCMGGGGEETYGNHGLFGRLPSVELLLRVEPESSYIRDDGVKQDETQFDANRRAKKRLNSSHDKNNGTYHSGERGKEPAS